jgi:hypothetical protein
LPPCLVELKRDGSDGVFTPTQCQRRIRI